MKKTLLMVAVVMASMLNYACAHGKGDKKEGNNTTVVQTGEGEVIPMDNNMFIKNIFDYTKAQEWNYVGDKPAIIDFYADWCGPCRRVAPIMKDLAKEYAGKVTVYKVDTDKEKQLASAMGITSLPTIVLIPVNGQPQVIRGAADKEIFQKAVKQILFGEQTE